MNANVLVAVFKRNFVSYFASPTGYVFICVFVLLSSFSAFWPYDFFNSNLANLDQLDKVFPFIMLIFIPAITMSIWAEERRQGTDELLLTIPAGDFEIVLGKYLAAVAIYSVSLLFSLVCNYAVLRILGQPDLGLFLSNYVGYWLVGLAMLAVGVVASFLTDNLTVAFILGALFNAPLVLAVFADVILPSGAARAVRQWSISEQFSDFGRGMVTLSGMAYFATIVVVMLYLSMVLIGRRHWARGRDWILMAGHYGLRTLALALVAVAVIVFCQHYDLRLDATSEQLSSLSPETRELLGTLKPERPVQIEAFVSPEVPESYVQARLDLLQMLRELQARGGNQVQVRVHNTERYSEEAVLAEQRFNINPRRVVTMKRGTMAEDYIFMGVAFTSGLEKVVLPFVDRGIPVEYELVRSICTVTQQKRRKIGIVQTDAQLYGRFDFQSMASSENWPIIDELEKMYDVVKVDASKPITERYDALLAVQPSSLGPEDLNNLVAAVRDGQPTAIFEDPFPGFAGNVPATSAPRRPPMMNPMMMMGQQPLPKGDIGQLWRLLGVDFTDNKIVWQNYNPYPKLGHLPPELVFVDSKGDREEHFNQSDPITSKLELLLFPFPGAISKLHASNLDFTALVRTGQSTGTVRYEDMLEMSFMGPRGLNPGRRQLPTSTSYVLVAHIHGKIPANQPMADDEPKEEPPAEKAADTGKPETEKPEAEKPAAEKPAAETPAAEMPAAESKPEEQPQAEAKPKAEEEKPKDTEINVVLVADIDMLHREFFSLREQGINPEMGLDFNFDNVTLVLDILDALAGDNRFIEIRKRRPKHRTLTRIDEYTEQARADTAKTREAIQDKFEKAREEEQKALDKQMDELRQRMKKEKIDDQEILRRVGIALKALQKGMQTKIDRLKQEQEQEIKRIETKLSLQIRAVQDWYKMWAVILPPIPPLLVAVGVFFTRRSREREGVARSRLKG